MARAMRALELAEFPLGFAEHKQRRGDRDRRIITDLVHYGRADVRD